MGASANLNFFFRVFLLFVGNGDYTGSVNPEGVMAEHTCDLSS